jgi:hypothetical protein
VNNKYKSSTKDRIDITDCSLKSLRLHYGSTLADLQIEKDLTWICDLKRVKGQGWKDKDQTSD